MKSNDVFAVLTDKASELEEAAQKIKNGEAELDWSRPGNIPYIASRWVWMQNNFCKSRMEIPEKVPNCCKSSNLTINIKRKQDLAFHLSEEFADWRYASPSVFVGPKPAKKFGSSKIFCPEPSRWNRFLYYALPDPMLITLKSNEMGQMDALDLDALKGWNGIPGVWSVWGSSTRNGSGMICLDVHEAVDCGYEMLMHTQMLEDLSKKESSYVLDLDGHDLFSVNKRTWCIGNWFNLKYQMVAADGLTKASINCEYWPMQKIIRELIEAQYAWQTQSYYWNRNYFQAVNAETRDAQMKNSYIMSRK